MVKEDIDLTWDTIRNSDSLPPDVQSLLESLAGSGKATNITSQNIPIQDIFMQKMRKWKGERFIDGMWEELPKGQYYDYIDGNYKDGEPELSFFDWYCEFINNEENYAKPLPMGECHREWGDILQNVMGYILMLCSRDHYKSSFCNVGFCLYNICEHPEIAKQEIMMVSWAKELAEDNYYSIQKNLNENQRIISFYGEILDLSRPCDSHSLFFNYQPLGARPGLICVSLQTGNITGRHPILCLMDDIEDEELSEQMMAKIRRIFMKKIFPAVGTKGRIIVTGTLKGYNKDNDIYLWLETRNIFSKYVYPAVNKMPPDSDVKITTIEHKVKRGRGYKIVKEYEVEVTNRNEYKLLYPERYTIEDIVVKRLLLLDDKEGDRIFYAEYMLEPLNLKGAFFNTDRLGHFPINNTYAKEFVTLNKDKIVGPYLWIDPGGKGNASHGNSIVILAKDKPDIGNNYYLLYIKRARLGLKETAEIVHDMYRYYDCEAWGVEGNFNQAETHANTLYEYIKYENKGEYFPYPVVKCNDLEKILRIRDIFSVMLGKNGMPIMFYVEDKTEDYHDFLTEFTSFPNMVSRRGEFDLIDAVCSCKTFLIDEDFEIAVMGYGWKDSDGFIFDAGPPTDTSDF